MSITEANYSLELASVMKVSGFGSAEGKMHLNTQLKLNTARQRRRNFSKFTNRATRE